MTTIYTEAFTLASIVIFGVFVIAGVVVTKRLWAPAPYLAPAFGVIIVALIALIVATTFFFSPVAGIIIAWVAFTGALVALRWFPWKRWGKVTLWSSAAVTAYAVGLVAFGFLWGANGYSDSTMATRFFWPLPPDNMIPNLFADKLWHQTTGEFLLIDWRASDRPPLQAGFILLERSLLQPFLELSNLRQAVALAVGVGLVAQLLWVPAMYSGLRALRFKPKSTILGLAAAAVTPVIFTNSLYSWPKLLSAGLMIAAIALCLEMLFRRQSSLLNLCIAGAAVGLSMLAHGAGAFVLPVLIGLALALLLRRQEQQTFARRLRYLAAAGLSCIVTLAPWVAYQRYVDPPGDRLLKWHFAGIISRREDLGFFDALWRQYAQLTPEQWASGKLLNLDTMLGLKGLINGLSTGSLSVDALKVLDFYSLAPATVLSVALSLILLAYFIVKRRFRSPASCLVSKVRLGLLGLMTLSLGIWVVAMFIPGSTVVHQGSHFFPLMFICFTFALGYEVIPKTTIVIFGLQAIFAVSLYVNSGLDAPGRIEPFAAAVVMASAMFSMWALKHLADLLAQNQSQSDLDSLTLANRRQILTNTHHLKTGPVD